ncbi:hypothetical protein BJ742DRAFT_864450 [Cladochytrium replicatum]|nr:hypothetical protein BJ742DRAFT_864450 [Cladochytrium replicatum]
MLRTGRCESSLLDRVWRSWTMPYQLCGSATTTEDNGLPRLDSSVLTKSYKHPGLSPPTSTTSTVQSQNGPAPETLPSSSDIPQSTFQTHDHHTSQSTFQTHHHHGSQPHRARIQTKRITQNGSRSPHDRWRLPLAFPYGHLCFLLNFLALVVLSGECVGAARDASGVAEVGQQPEPGPSTDCSGIWLHSGQPVYTSTAANTSADSLLIFGGLNHTNSWVCEIIDDVTLWNPFATGGGSWVDGITPLTVNTDYTPTAGHASVAIKNTGVLHTFGSITPVCNYTNIATLYDGWQFSSTPNRTTSTVNFFDVTLTSGNASLPVPAKRWMHSLAFDEERYLYLLGGDLSGRVFPAKGSERPSGISLNVSDRNIYKINFDTGTLTATVVDIFPTTDNLSTSGLREELVASSMVYLNKVGMYSKHFLLSCFGMGRNMTLTNECDLFDIYERKWMKDIPIEGVRPSPRVGALMVVIDQGQARVFGGGDLSHDQFYSDVWDLDLTQLPMMLKWTMLAPDPALTPIDSPVPIAAARARGFPAGGVLYGVNGSYNFPLFPPIVSDPSLPPPAERAHNRVAYGVVGSSRKTTDGNLTVTNTTAERLGNPTVVIWGGMVASNDGSPSFLQAGVRLRLFKPISRSGAFGCVYSDEWVPPWIDFFTDGISSGAVIYNNQQPFPLVGSQSMVATTVWALTNSVFILLVFTISTMMVRSVSFCIRPEKKKLPKHRPPTSGPVGWNDIENANRWKGSSWVAGYPQRRLRGDAFSSTSSMINLSAKGTLNPSLGHHFSAEALGSARSDDNTAYTGSRPDSNQSFSGGYDPWDQEVELHRGHIHETTLIRLRLTRSASELMNEAGDETQVQDVRQVETNTVAEVPTGAGMEITIDVDEPMDIQPVDIDSDDEDTDPAIEELYQLYVPQSSQNHMYLRNAVAKSAIDSNGIEPDNLQERFSSKLPPTPPRTSAELFPAPSSSVHTPHNNEESLPIPVAQPGKSMKDYLGQLIDLRLRYCYDHRPGCRYYSSGGGVESLKRIQHEMAFGAPPERNGKPAESAIPFLNIGQRRSSSVPASRGSKLVLLRMNSASAANQTSARTDQPLTESQYGTVRQRRKRVRRVSNEAHQPVQPVPIPENGHYRCPFCGGRFFGTLLRRGSTGSLLEDQSVRGSVGLHVKDLAVPITMDPGGVTEVSGSISQPVGVDAGVYGRFQTAGHVLSQTMSTVNTGTGTSSMVTDPYGTGDWMAAARIS